MKCSNQSKWTTLVEIAIYSLHIPYAENKLIVFSRNNGKRQTTNDQQGKGML